MDRIKIVIEVRNGLMSRIACSARAEVVILDHDEPEHEPMFEETDIMTRDDWDFFVPPFMHTHESI